MLLLLLLLSPDSRWPSHGLLMASSVPELSPHCLRASLVCALGLAVLHSVTSAVPRILRTHPGLLPTPEVSSLQEWFGRLWEQWDRSQHFCCEIGFDKKVISGFWQYRLFLAARYPADNSGFNKAQVRNSDAGERKQVRFKHLLTVWPSNFSPPLDIRVGPRLARQWTPGTSWAPHVPIF